jgi:CD2 antigen cytoplasmic tail-binding protein 2
LALPDSFLHNLLTYAVVSFRNPVNHMHPDDIEGEEAGDTFVNAEEEVKFTPFNMREELEEGHFDKNGHYHFKKGEDHLDNWLDDIDWVKVKKNENYRKKYYTADGEYSSDEEEAVEETKIDHLASFKEILTVMQRGESINAALQRLNKSKIKVTTAQRWKMKKQGIVDESSEMITKVTGIVNEILTKTGNMNVYELTYEQIEHKIKEMEDKKDAGSSKAADLDMYADDFDEKEQGKLSDKSVTFKLPESTAKVMSDEEPKLMWEYKLTSDENDKILGPFSTEQMAKKMDDGDFKETVYVRKVGDERFYSSARIDFDLYL